MRAISLILALLMVSCTPLTATSNCLPLREWSVEDQQNMKADLETLPDNSPLIKAMQDYAAMRAETRACQGAQ